MSNQPDHSLSDGGLAERMARLIVHGRAPYNAEPPLDRLRASWRTAAADFYVRSHGDLPAIDAEAYRLEVGGAVGRKLSLSLTEIQAMPQATVTATLQCAGNRRADMRAVAPVSGDPWDAGAIGTADWTGPRLADVLAAAGFDRAHAQEDLHVAFACHDTVEGEAYRYGASIPMAKALAPETLLAHAMNGEPLLPEHGFPLRAVVPGYAGVRSPKWLASITVQDRPSDNPIQAGDYKFLPPQVDPDKVGPDDGITIETMPLNSAICEPARGASLPAGLTAVRGYAVCGDRTVARVDVSGDSGRTWAQASLEREAEAPFAWTFWSIDLDLPPGEHELAVRAWDAAGQTQPAAADDTWNRKGYLSTAWHRVRVTVG
ncbi:sulfite dehydrogenase (cytochrome) subunit SorA apoprotein [Methylobacterium phyllostachyos]|uniref:Sulfite dehydrogenase (Cytochrome) subunit SorA apoprotein n=1 Tax=Methylobacterium phyllostachyos TaxID=582672 RepID=A0A1G9S5P6_9HYPH|nr:molybdopterin-dependent oxidoreductase [Methylobacterium phyllostachyos]SDM30823.1 sulfite dehydrogenase (cytochrome) subunit SorA apoprotein [Methylobacterium phyllostachyos]